ncbi:hypothetical protein ZWY2020_041071 [Hordeum vulgare]|nr:hypothetical protein ZWY2020_041071 [Hordeum vulgare]
MYRTCASNYSHSTDVPSSTNTSQEGETGFMVEDEDDYFLSQQGTHGFNEGYTDLDKYMAEVTLSFSKVKTSLSTSTKRFEELQKGNEML